MRVTAVRLAPLLDGAGEEAAAVEDVGVLREEAEDEPRHEVIHIVAAGFGPPFRVLAQQLDVDLVEAAGRPRRRCGCP